MTAPPQPVTAILGVPTTLPLVATVPAPTGRAAVAAYLARLAPSSRRKVLESLELLARAASGGRLGAEAFPWERLRYPHTSALRAWLADRGAPATATRHLSALRGVLRECWRLGLVDAEAYHRAADVPAVKAETLPRGRAISRGEMSALFAACAADPSAAGARDAALLAVLYGAGLRRAEAVALDVLDYDPETGALTVRSGKGRKDRITYLGPGGRAAVDAWLDVRGRVVGPLFLPVRKGGASCRGASPTRASPTPATSGRARRACAAHSAPTTCAAPSSATSSTPAPTSPPSSASPGTPR